MSGKTPSRHVQSPSSPGPSSSKLSKFLPKGTRDRSKSVNESVSGSMSTPEYVSPASLAMAAKRRSKKEKGRSRDSSDLLPPPQEEPPVIVEPVAIPRPRTRSERPISESGHIGSSSAAPANYSYTTIASSSPSRVGDMSSRLSGWFTHTFSNSSTDLSLPSLLSQSHHGHSSGYSSSSPSPTRKMAGGASALLTAAKHGKGHLDKAVRYLMDSDTTPDKCMDPIWLLGVQHPGYEPPPPPSSMPPGGSGHHRRGSLDSRRNRGSSSSIRSYDSSQNDFALSQSQPPSAGKHPGAFWPPVFYEDFVSRVWLTYRSQFTSPIKDGRLADLDNDNASSTGTHASTQSATLRKWPWGGEKEWTSDSGWGCMLRTGQSLLANALVHVHLGREWRRPAYPVRTAEYATYVEIVTWFLDTPSPEAPFSVHRMALAGKELGTDVGQWFGPSIAAGAIKSLSEAYPEAGIGVSVGSDGQFFQSDVYAASHGRRRYPQSRGAVSSWGNQPVLLLLGMRLGLNGVNPIYYETIKILYTFPQSVGIAGGRPSSSYYFVGSQADNLFYLDPHHARPAVPLRHAPPGPSPHEHEKKHHTPTSPSSSVRTGSSTFSYHAPSSPSPLNHQRSRTSSPGMLTEADLTPGEPLDAVQSHYVSAYSQEELATFHCDRVRKMPLSGLDPSMLVGFLCRDEADWKDFRQRVERLPKHVFSVQDEPPKWPSDSDDSMGLESMSMAMSDDMVVDDREFEDEEEGSADSVNSRDVDTEEDPVGPLTPGPGSHSSKFHDVQHAEGKFPVVDDREDDDIEDDWVETAVGSTPPSTSPSPPPAKSRSSSGKKVRHQKPVPVPKVTLPPEQTSSSSFAFPVISAAEAENGAGATSGGNRMHTARARDGGRTQSGGVKGVFTED